LWGAVQYRLPSASTARAKIHRPNEDRQESTASALFEQRVPVSRSRFGTDNAAFAALADPSVLEYRGKLAATAARAGPIRAHSRRAGGGNDPDWVPAPA